MGLLKGVVGQNPRQIAARVLGGRPGADDYIENRLEAALAEGRLTPPDRALCHHLVHGVARWQDTLDWLIARKTGGRPQRETLAILLRLGLYQMLWLDRIPNHAAVNESVEMAKTMGFAAQAGFVNAILRGYAREREATLALLADLKTREPALGYAHPAWLVARWQGRWGAENCRRLMDWNNNPPPTFARVNRLRTTPEELGARWVAEGVRFVPRRYDWVPGDGVFELESHPPLAGLPSFQAGGFYLQDPSTLLAVAELGPQPGESILDTCAAPGGKTVLAAQWLRNQGRIVARDSQPDRLALVGENCARLGVTCVTLEPGDGRTRLDSDGPRFDRVLVDAPCSNTGVMRRRVELRRRIQEAELTRMTVVQGALLREAAATLRPGGTLVYSTCSLEPEENGAVVQAFLAARPDFKLMGERQLLPFVDGVDGAYVARLEAPGKTDR